MKPKQALDIILENMYIHFHQDRRLWESAGIIAMLAFLGAYLFWGY